MFNDLSNDSTQYKVWDPSGEKDNWTVDLPGHSDEAS